MGGGLKEFHALKLKRWFAPLPDTLLMAKNLSIDALHY